MRGPGFVMLGVGREFAVQSYVDFVAHAGVKAFSLEEPQIDVCDHIAAAQYSWEMTYALEGQEYTERGHDLFVLARRAEKWVVVWRAMLPDPARDLAT